ncbi:AbrB family transcriptional regulator [Thermococcus sp.]|uniref:AbrB/MazE/SpoVT family DNA-binding domain-containing protein n=1 Tax=Thermococcus sp. TaxID=35749 RepID=UPI002624B801|nr:AbrB family transcriptional regulator [Thermococcus sp.]
MLTKVDQKGRLYIPKAMREGLSEEVYLVRLDEGILIVPKPRDPLKELEELGRKLPDKSIRELRKEIVEEATKEAEGAE